MVKESTKLLLLSDVDAVITDWFNGYRSFLSKEKGIESNGNMPAVFHMTDVYPHIEKPWEHIIEYQESRHYQSMPFFNDVTSTLMELRKIDVEVHFVTSCGDSEKIKAGRDEYMERWFSGLYERIHYLGLGEDKSRIFNLYKDVNVPVVYIDDQEKMLPASCNMGFESVLKCMPYNQDAGDKYPRVSNFSSLGELVKERLMEQDRRVTPSTNPPKINFHEDASNRKYGR